MKGNPIDPAQHPASSAQSERRTQEENVDVDRRRSGDRRLAERVLTDLEVDYSSDDTFLFANSANITNLSSMGIFVQTRTPSPVGTRLNLRFTPPNVGKPIAVVGEVVWVNPYRPDDINNLNPGMGISLTGLTIEQREILVDLVRCIAFLPEDD